MKKLSEVVEIVDLKRRAIQEYENTGLANKPTHKNKYGYLLYTEEEIERLWQLKFFKELGYDSPKIKEIESKSDDDKKKQLENTIADLKKKREMIDNMINIAEIVKETGLDIKSLRYSLKEMENVPADDIFALIALGYDNKSDQEFEELFNIDIVTEEEWERIGEEFEKIIIDYRCKKSVSDFDVQEKIKSIHELLVKAISESIIMLRFLVVLLAPEGDIGKDIAAEIGGKELEYIQKAVQYYCDSNMDNAVDAEFVAVFDNLEKLACQKYTTRSKEVQREVGKLFRHFDRMNVLTEKGKKYFLQRYSMFLGSDACKKMYDKGRERGVVWFMSRSIEIYCSRLEC